MGIKAIPIHILADDSNEIISVRSYSRYSHTSSAFIGKI
jgi:hypothetical protein